MGKLTLIHYFIVETKGSSDEILLKVIEKAKIDCAEILFKTLNQENERFGEPVKYKVLKTYKELLDLVQPKGKED